MNRILLCLAVSAAIVLCSYEQASAGPLGRLLLGDSSHRSAGSYRGSDGAIPPSTSPYGPAYRGNYGGYYGGNYGGYNGGYFGGFPAPIGPFPSIGNYYPQYYGGFHSRYFQDIGSPSGDRGLRGSAW
jgi:hypothetical protein